MSKAAQIREAVAEVLRAAAGFPRDMAWVARKPQTLENAEAQAVSAMGMAGFVLPPLPKRRPILNEAIFFSSALLIVRIVEIPEMNSASMDGHDVVENVMSVLHWSNPGGLLQQPLQLSEQPIEFTEGEIELEHGQKAINGLLWDVRFEAKYSLGTIN